MMIILLLLVPLISGLLCFISSNKTSRILSIVMAIISVTISAQMHFDFLSGDNIEINLPWMSSINSHFHMKLTSWNILMVHLTTLSFLLVYAWISETQIKKANRFYALMALTQVGLYGVFLSFDALLFYFFWELALVPVYFLSSTWGGPRRIIVTFKFFIYTFVGSVLMLIAILFLYYRHHMSFEWTDWIDFSDNVASMDQKWLFILMLIGFAIKIPLFPFHSWQPELYNVAPKPVVMILSAVMAKMGLFAILQWQLFVLPEAFDMMGKVVITLSSVGILYASLIAMVEDNLNKILAYSSIAHLSLMALALFTDRGASLEGVSFQMFSHGIVVLGLWMIVDRIEQSFGTAKLSEIKGGLAKTSPTLATFFILFGFANMALPLTSSFIGEFLILKSVFNYQPSLMLIVGLTVVFSAVYTLRMLRKTLYGAPSNFMVSINSNQWIVLAWIAGTIVLLGVYPKPVLDLITNISQQILAYVH